MVRKYFIFLFCLPILLLNISVLAKDIFINDTKIEGLKNLSERKILFHLEDKFKTGDVDSNNIINELYNLGYFSSIEIFRKNNLLNINVIERPYIESVKIYGEKDKSAIYLILNENNIKIGDIYNFVSLDLFKRKIEQYYINNGIHNINIDIKIDINTHLNSANVLINIYKYNKQRIKNIKIIGNKIFSNRKLLNLLTQSSSNWMSWFSNDNVFLKGKLISDLDNIKAHYLDHGFVNFQINFARIYLSKNKKDIFIVLSVFEGEKYYISSIDIHSNTLAFDNKLRHIIYSNINSGDIFSRKKLFNVKKYIKDFFYSKGYINASIDFRLANSGNNMINIEFIFEQSAKVIVRNISFVGNNITDDHVLRKFIPQMENTWISIDEINFGKEEIIRNGLASNVDIEFINYSNKKEEVDVIYKVIEQKTTKFIAGFSYNYGDGIVLNVGSELSNFLGNGKDIIINLNSNKMQSDYTFGYFNPQFTESGIGVGYNIYYKTEQLGKNTNNFDHASSTFGAYLYYSFKIGKYKKINFGIGCDMTRLQVYEETAPTEIKNFISKEGLDYKEYYLTSIFTYNSLDKFIFPTCGISQRAIFRLSMPGSDIKYYTLNYDFNYYKQLSFDYIFNFYSVIGYGNKYGSTYRYPFFKNFFIKGINNIRGFKDKTIGPRDSNGESFGGNILVNFKISLFLPVPILSDIKTIRTGLFLDIGQVYNTYNVPKKREKNRYLKVSTALRCSSGFSLIWNTPFGVPLEISIAYPLNKKRTDKLNIVSLSMGMQLN